MLFSLWTNRVRGPVDNISCYGTDYIYSLCDKSYLNIVLNDENIQHLPDTTIYKINSLSLDIIHNKPDKEWKNQQIKRYVNFRKLLIIFKILMIIIFYYIL